MLIYFFGQNQILDLLSAGCYIVTATAIFISLFTFVFWGTNKLKVLSNLLARPKADDEEGNMGPEAGGEASFTKKVIIYLVLVSLISALGWTILVNVHKPMSYNDWTESEQRLYNNQLTKMELGGGVIDNDSLQIEVKQLLLLYRLGLTEIRLLTLDTSRSMGDMNIKKRYLDSLFIQFELLSK